MSLFSERPIEDGGDDKRAKKLEAARKKLKSYRASRSSITSSQSSRSGSGSPTKLSISKPLSRRPIEPPVPQIPGSRRGSTSTPHSRTPSLSAPLGDSNAGNFSPSARRPSKGKERAVEASPKADSSPAHRRKGSRASHGRNGSLAVRASVMGVFDLPPVPFAFGGESPATNTKRLDMPHEIITTPATPLPDTVDLDPLSLSEHSSSSRHADGDSEEDMETARSRLSSFSFGSKPPTDAPLRRMARTPSPNRYQQPLPPSMALRMHDLGNFKLPSPLSSPSSSQSAPSNLHRLSQTPSRPPSLLLTEPSPLPTSPTAADRASAACPQTPPAVSRVKRHSHSRSSSISLPNLKLSGARPVSLGVPTSPSFSTSPSSPSPLTSPSFDRNRPNPLNSTARLKFEPSGRGAEADKEKEEYRRQALAKLTAASSPTPSPITQEQEIALPELDDADDVSSIVSSNRPESDIWGSTSSGWGRPNSLTLSGAGASNSPTPFWATTDSNAAGVGNERWSGGSGFGFGIRDEGLGFGLDLGAVKRGSLTSGLSVLAEVEEVEELEENEVPEPAEGLSTLEPEAGSSVDSTPTQVQAAYGGPSPAPEDRQTETTSTAPTPTAVTSRLRGFRLSSSASNTPVRVDDKVGHPKTVTPTSISPTKGYGAIGRGRPKPLSNLVTSASTSSPLTSSTIASAPLVTPTSGTPGTRRRGRGSSISYRKDQNESVSTTSANASMSSRDWAYDRKSASPLTSISSLEVTSPTLLSLGGFGSPSWESSALRNANRPCPRPKSMATQAADAGANRILSNVTEEDGDWPTDASLSFKSGHNFTLSDEDVQGNTSGHRVFDSVVFRDHTLELEMERDALREDVEGWRERCRMLEDNLDKEKKESGVLRERVRKLGDRLLTMSTAPPPDATSLDERAMIQMRDQFFQLTASLERERREKEDAVKRIEAMQAFMIARGVELSQFSPPSPPASTGAAGWTFASAQSAGKMAPAKLSPKVPTLTPKYGDPFLSTNPPSLPAPTQQDPNLHRMKAWGFPSPTSAPLPSPKITPNKRDSFFGLSAMLRKRDSVPLSTEQECLGIDLPPIVLPPLHSSYSPPKTFGTPRAVSDPYRQTSKGSPSDSDPHRSVSLPLSAGSSTSTGAFSFISGYWRSKSSGPASNASNGSPTSASTPGSNRSGSYCKRSPPRFEPSDLARTMTLSNPGANDLAHGCSCCQGPVIEL